MGLLPHARSRVFSCAAFSCTNASAGPMAGIRPQPGALWLPWPNGTPGNGAAAPAGSVSAGTHLVREFKGELGVHPRQLGVLGFKFLHLLNSATLVPCVLRPPVEIHRAADAVLAQPITFHYP